MIPKILSFVDLETTGANIVFNRIMEIGIIRVENGKITKKYSKLINPQTQIDPFVETLTGIHLEDLENAPTFYDVKDEILEILKDSIFAAHNVRFDYGFLRNEFKRFDINFTSKHFDTAKLARLLYPKMHHVNLDVIIEKFNIKCKDRHRAYGDAKAIHDFYKKVKKEINPEKFDKVMDLALRRPSVPTSITEEELELIPENPGVYVFYGDNDAPLYIGKSVNIKDRVLSHFSNDHFSATEMKIAQTVRRIETIETDGEFGALLLESSMIKKTQPLHNRQLRLSKKLIGLRKIKDKKGYLTVEQDILQNVDINNLDNIIGVFKSKKELKTFLYQLIEEHTLCPKIMGIEKTDSYCFSYHLKKCNGACKNEENPLKYNIRFIEAFSHSKIKPWPFVGPIVIKEEGESKEYFIFDKWCFLGNFDDENIGKSEYHFDYDTYKILKRFLSKETNLRKVKTLRNIKIESL